MPTKNSKEEKKQLERQQMLAWANKFHLSPVRVFGEGDDIYIAVALLNRWNKPYLRLWNVNMNDELAEYLYRQITGGATNTGTRKQMPRSSWRDDLDVSWADRGKVWIIDDGEFVIDALTNGKIAELREDLRRRYGDHFKPKGT